MIDHSDEVYLKKRKIQLLKSDIERKESLPHLYGQKFYPWSRQFWESRNKYTLLCASNQIGKSSIQIRKDIHWATEPTLWSSLWGMRPLTFWYLYPTLLHATSEFEQKWLVNFMPRGRYERDPQYGWEVEYARGNVSSIHFKSGVSILFKSYATDVRNLQTGTVWKLSCDEELPEYLFDELNLRLAATNGYFSMAFTATLGQEFWRETMENVGSPKERFKGAKKIRASMYDCLTFEDGMPSHWTHERIQEIEKSCRDEVEVQVRVYGKFSKLRTGLKYGTFIRSIHLKDPVDLPPDWLIYSGIDIGSGGDAHPGAICLVAVSPDYRKARVIKGWVGDKSITTASDILNIYIQLRGGMTVTAQFYDFASRDFFTIASRMGEPFITAEKRQDIGQQIINTLFRNQMLTIDDIPELQPLCHELETLEHETKKNHAVDNFSDAFRYAVTKIPWDWTAVGMPSMHDLKISTLGAKKKLSQEEEERRGLTSQDEEALMDVSEEIESWNELYEI